MKSDTFDIAEELIKVLLYFDIFSYPLTKKEIVSYSTISPERWGEVVPVLDKLEKGGLVNLYGGLYFIGQQRNIITKRLKGNDLAVKRIQTAKKYARLISWFPFVRGIFLSGSLSKGYSGEKDDIDYFIVTEPGRLWLVRSLLTIFKKVFLLNSYRNFCINYFVDSDHLYIEEHNRFTATEIVFLIPLFNSDIYKEFMIKNIWVREFYPNFSQGIEHCRDKIPLSRKWTEKILAGYLADKLDNFLFRKSGSYIKGKFSGMKDKNFSRRFSIHRHELRYLPGSQNAGIMKRYHDRIKNFMKNKVVSARIS